MMQHSIVKGTTVFFIFLWIFIYAPTASAKKGTWIETKSNDPWGVTYQAFMAYNYVQDQLIMIIAGDDRTWCLQNNKWTSIGEKTPRLFNIMGIAYDENLNKIIMLGHTFNHKPGKPPGTWEWDGFSWTEVRCSINPPSCMESALAYDPLGKQLILFGGNHLTYSNYPGDIHKQTWAWNGINWKKLEPQESPSERMSAGMVTDKNNSRIILYGGNDIDSQTGESILMNDTWSWNGFNWDKINTTAAPSPRGEFGIGYESVTGRIIIHGGSDTPGEGFDETWSFLDNTWQKIAKNTKPGSRWDPAVGFNGKNLIMFGGNSVYEKRIKPKSINPKQYHRHPTRDTWKLNGNKWENVCTSNWPGAYWHVNLTYDSSRQRLIVFGDQRIMEFDGKNWTENIIYRYGKWPLDTHYSALVFDDSRDLIIIFGGYGGGFRNALWEWNGKKIKKISPSNTPPEPRAYMASVFASQENALVIFGGQQGNNIYDETWLYFGDTRTWEKIERKGPEARYQTAMAYDKDNNQVVLFGGRGASGKLDDTWVLDLATRTWEEKNPKKNPGERTVHSMCYDPVRKRVLLFGGVAGYVKKDCFILENYTWEWNGKNWKRYRTPEMPGRYFTAMAYDTQENAPVIFGGRTTCVNRQISLADLWHYK